MMIPFVFLIFTPRAQAAIELSLESNRVERGNIGYVDMEKLFEEFPETIAAKKKFKKDLQKAEDKINLEKIGILHLRQDLSELRMERRYEQKNQSKSSSQKAVLVSSSVVTSSSPAAVTLSSAAVATPRIQGSSQTYVSSRTVQGAPIASVVPSSAVAASSSVAVSSASAPKNGGAPLDRNLISALPGFGQSSLGKKSSHSMYLSSATSSAVNTPSAPHISSMSSVASPPSVSSQSLPSNPVFDISSTHQKPISPAQMSVQQLNAKINKEKQEIAQDQAALKQDESSIEKNLLNLENRETQGLLGKIYKVIREVATESGVSVVVDKSQILYGHNAVDLTDKVLKRLKVLKESGGFQ